MACDDIDRSQGSEARDVGNEDMLLDSEASFAIALMKASSVDDSDATAIGAYSL